MTAERRIWVAKMISLLVCATGIVVISGWFLNLSALKNLSPFPVTMKFDTAIAFVCSGISLYFIARFQEGAQDFTQVVLSATSLIIFMLMGIMFFSVLLGIQTGIEDMFIQEKDPAPQTVIPGRPSIPAMISFLLVGLAGIFVLLGTGRLLFKFKVIGLIVASIGIVAVCGHMFNAPSLTYFIDGVNSAMAFNTAALFVFLGIGFLCL